MALTFPSSPSVGQKYPAPSVVGIPTYVWDGEKWTTVGGNIGNSYVSKGGDVMTGLLQLSGDPTAVLHAVTKQYVDARPTTDASKVAKTGDTMTGTLKISVVGDQARLQGASYGVILRNDDANYYTLLTNASDPNGSWNAFRPFTINLATGNVSMAQALTVGGTLNGADIYASRSAGVGYCFLGTNGAHYVGFDGTSYQMPSGASLQIGTPINGASAATVTWTDNNYLPRAGGTITGALAVNGAFTTQAGVTFNGGWTANNGAQNIYNNGSNVMIQGAGGSYDALMTFHRPGSYATNFGLANDNTFRWGGWSAGVAWYRFWTEANCGWPASDGRLLYLTDYLIPRSDNPVENWGGSVMTGAWQRNSDNLYGNRYRYMQLNTSSWYTIGYAG